MRRNDDIELFSMSFLDLISCAMAGILVLYTVADRSNEAARARRNAPGHISVSFQDGKVGQLDFCVRFENGGRVYESSSSRRNGAWVIKEHPLIALLQLNEPVAAGASLTLYVEDFDPAIGFPDDGEVVASIIVCTPGTAQGIRDPIPIHLKEGAAFYVTQPL